MLKHGTIIINEDEVIATKQATPEYINDDDDLDDDSYPILNKELRKQIIIFERESFLKWNSCLWISGIC